MKATQPELMGLSSPNQPGSQAHPQNPCLHIQSLRARESSCSPGEGAGEQGGVTRREDSAGVSTPEKLGATEAAAPGPAVKGGGTCGHAQASGWTARQVARPFSRTEHRQEPEEWLACSPQAGAFTSTKTQHRLAANTPLGHLNIWNWLLGKVDARFCDLRPQRW